MKVLPFQQAFPDKSSKGITKREFFAGLAMMGLLASGVVEVSADAIAEADELLEKLAPHQEGPVV